MLKFQGEVNAGDDSVVLTLTAGKTITVTLDGKTEDVSEDLMHLENLQDLMCEIRELIAKGLKELKK